MIGAIQQNTAAHERSSAGVAETVIAILDTARESSARLPQLAAAIAELRATAQPQPPARE